MSILFHDEEETHGKVNIDDLYERKHQKDLKQLSIFNKLLARIHKRVQYTSRQKHDEKHIWFIVPEFMFGEPVYDKGECVGYLVSKLTDNGFHVQYVHPNTLFVSWHNWVPAYARSELRKRLGIVMDEHGNILDRLDREGVDPDDRERAIDLQRDPSSRMAAAADALSKSKKEYKSTSQYKPTGHLVYSPELLDNIERKIR